MKFKLKSTPAAYIKSTLLLFVMVNLVYPKKMFTLKNNSKPTMPGIATNIITLQGPIVLE